MLSTARHSIVVSAHPAASALLTSARPRLRVARGLVLGALLLGMAAGLPVHALGYELLVSSVPDRSMPTPLEGASVTGSIYVFVPDEPEITGVRFYLDDPDMSGSPRGAESNPPYDLAGGFLSSADPFDTNQLAEGLHTITAAIDRDDGGTVALTASFRVMRVALLWSATSDRTGPVPLDGSQARGNVHVFTPPQAGVSRVRFFLDNPSMSGPPRHTENSPPFDFAGGSTSAANPFDTTLLPDGLHTITAALDLDTGASQVVTATFAVANSAALLFDRSGLSLSLPQGAVTSSQVVLNASAGTATYAASENASWLTVVPGTGATPATLILQVSAAVLTPGTYTASVTATAPGYASDTLPVTVTVEDAGSTGAYGILWSRQATRQAPEPLANAEVSGDIHVFLSPDSGVARVRFYLDDPELTGPPRQVENSPPWDLVGGLASAANPLATTTLTEGVHTLTAAVELLAGGTELVSAIFTVANTGGGGTPPPPGGGGNPPPSGGTSVAIVGNRFAINGVVTYPGTVAEGKLLNVRMANSVFEDTGRPNFDPEANTDEFITAMPDYVANGVLAFTISLQGGNPGYEGAINTAFRSDGSLKISYLGRVRRVVEAADSLGAVIILGLYYQRQDQRLANDAAIRAGVVNVASWVTENGLGNVILEIANEYPHGGFDHPLIQSASGMASLIRLAKQTAPQLYVSASGLGDGQLDEEVAEASDYLLIHFNNVTVADYEETIAGLAGYGKPIVVNEDSKDGVEGASAAERAVQNGASWGLFLRSNQDYPFEFLGADDDPTVYARIRSLAGL